MQPRGNIWVSYLWVAVGLLPSSIDALSSTFILMVVLAVCACPDYTVNADKCSA